MYTNKALTILGFKYINIYCCLNIFIFKVIASGGEIYQNANVRILFGLLDIYLNYLHQTS